MVTRSSDQTRGTTPAEAREQLARDIADLCPGKTLATCGVYMPWDILRVVVGGHEYETRVDRLDVGMVDGAWQVVVFTRDGRVWQQAYLGGWMVSWHGPKARYEPLLSTYGESRIIGRRDAVLETRDALRREGTR